jgi:hypothetical protein
MDPLDKDGTIGGEIGWDMGVSWEGVRFNAAAG